MTQREKYTFAEAEEFRKRLAMGAKEGDAWWKYTSDDWWMDEMILTMRDQLARILQFKVKVSEITEEGFWVDTYKERFYVLRETIPAFQNATDEELQTAYLFPANNEYGDILCWKLLGLRISVATVKEGKEYKNPYIEG